LTEPSPMQRFSAAISLLLAVAPVVAGDSPTALVIHGGAAVIEREALSAGDERAIRAVLDEALDAGHAILAGGGSALDAVEAAVGGAREESPRLSGGRGAGCNRDGRRELGASVMEGHTRRAGAVAAVTTVRNPVRLARRVMERSPHVMLIGDGAERFADEHPD